MVKILPIPCSERLRWRLSTALGIINFISILFGIILIILGLIVKFRLQNYIHLLGNYDIGLLPNLLLSAGGLATFLHLSAGFLYLFHNHSGNRKKLRKVIYLYLFVGVVVSLVVLSAGLSCYSHLSHLETAFHRGIQQAMQKYVMGKKTKRIIDQLQMEFECCGSTKYTDWFKVDWIPEPYRQDYAIQDVTNELV